MSVPLILYVVHFPVSASMLSPFRATGPSKSGVKYMARFPWIRAGSDVARWIRALAYGGCVVYGVGIPVLLGALLLRLKHK
jgi:hypothetical protein